MTIRKRLKRLEGQRGHHAWDDRPPVILSRADMTEDRVIGIRTGSGSEVITRLPGESFDDLVSRARALLATPWAGLPLIMACAYADQIASDAA
jgi:hypothetical protein